PWVDNTADQRQPAVWRQNGSLPSQQKVVQTLPLRTRADKHRMERVAIGRLLLLPTRCYIDAIRNDMTKARLGSSLDHRRFRECACAYDEVCMPPTISVPASQSLAQPLASFLFERLLDEWIFPPILDQNPSLRVRMRMKLKQHSPWCVFVARRKRL